MKKATFLFLLLNGALFAQYTAIPDPNFEQALIDLGYDDDLDGQVLTANIENVIELIVTDKNINDLTGIEDFTSLEILWSGSNNYTTINLSQNIELKELNLLGLQPLTALDVSANINLEALQIACPLINTIDLSNNPNLVEFYSRGDFSNLTSIDVSNNPLLEILRIRSNDISELDLSNNPLIYVLECDNNPISSLTVSNLNDLSFLFVAKTLLTEIDVSQNVNIYLADFSSTQITTLDLSNTLALAQVWSNSNPNLESIDLRNGNNLLLDLRAINNPNLTCIYVDDKDNLPRWEVDSTANFVETEAECAALEIDDFDTISFAIYPNPTNGYFAIKSNRSVEEISIFDISGKLIKTFTEQNEYDVSELSKGMYLINIKSSMGNSVEKLILK